MQSPVSESTVAERAQVAEICKTYAPGPEHLIPLLQEVQKELGCVPEWALMDAAEFLGLPPSRLFGVATFYAQFRLEPIGKHIIRLCRGTACHVRRSRRILLALEARLGVGPGRTTRDRLFTLETVACFGSCALAPVMVVDDIVYGRMTPAKALEIVERLEQESPELSRGDFAAADPGRPAWTSQA